MKRILTTIALFAITSLLFFSCKDDDTSTEKETMPAIDLAAAKKTIEEANVAFSDLVKKGDSTALAAMYASDAKLMGANMPSITGTNNISATFGEMFRMGIGGVTLTTSGIWGNESLLSEEGTFSLMDKAGKEIDKGKYIVLWKMEDGKWKIFRDCWNSDLPMPAPAKYAPGKK